MKGSPHDGKDSAIDSPDTAVVPNDIGYFARERTTFPPRPPFVKAEK
jgi:hypothetical protein